jgi:hypothetical protein
MGETWHYADVEPKQGRDREMFTHRYRGGFIHGYFDRDECLWQWREHHGRARSYRAAQLRITMLENITGKVSADNPAIEAIDA